ncbi:MAG: EAL domain-containing protein [Methylotenera sp.]|nr:EAL domain-containing protein [Methylotenera sp.]
MIKIHDNPIIFDEGLHYLIEAIPDAIFLKDGEGRWLVTNEAAKFLFKLQGIAWQGKTDKELGAERPEMRTIHAKCLEDDKATWDARKLMVFMESVVDEAGNVHEYEVRKAPVFDKNGKRKALIIIGRDVTDRKLAESNLRIADTAIESLEAIVITDINNKILRVNSSFTRLTGYGSEEVIGKTTAIMKSGRHDKAFYQAMWKTLAEKKFWQGEIWDRRKNGEIYPKWLTITAVTGPDGQVNNYVGAFVDLSERKEAKEAIHHLAYYDPLTDLPNRRLLRDHLDLALSNSARNQHYGAVLMVDLDNFKLINDTKGHAVGDLLLVEVAHRLKSCVREADTVARLGGDEFVILLESLSKDLSHAAIQAEVVSKKILKVINQPFLIAGYELYSSLSIGISLFTLPVATTEEMLKRSDAAMYQAKFAGRNTIRFFDPDVHATLEKRLKIEAELRQALPENQLKLNYQAQVDHQSNVLGAEALLRWEHPQHGLVPPNEFIPLAEESELILLIGEWVLYTACLQLKKWESNPLTQDLILAVNVSARQFGQPNFVLEVCRVLEETKVRASHLKLELTESLVLQNVASAIEKMEALKLLGIRFSIDDFGTGYSSLSYLTKLPISQLKIDRSFVSRIDTDKNDAVIAQTIIGMANTLGFNVIAEGVETEAQRLCLENYGCPSYQGYLFSKPLPLMEFESLVNKTMKRIA